MPGAAAAALLAAAGDPARLTLADCTAAAVEAAAPGAWRPCHNQLEAGGALTVDADAAAERALVAAGCRIAGRDAVRGLNATTGAPPAGYTPPEEMLQKYRALQEAHPGLARLIDLNDAYGTPPTHEGRHMHALKVSDDVGADEDEPNVLFFTGIHANEVMGPELNYFAAERLLSGYARNAELRALVDRYQIYFVASGNPDGLAYVWSTNSNWRKNRRPNAGGSFGVDMNRNYPFGWDFPQCRGSDSYTSSGYRGPGPASEPEVQTGIALQNDRNFERVFDFHTGCGPDVRYNYAAADMLPPEIDEYAARIASVLAAEMGIGVRRALNCGTEPSFAYHNRGSLSFLSEISRAHQPQEATMRAVLESSWPGVFDFLARPTPASGRVVDARSRRGVGGAALALPDLAFRYNETKVTSPFGRFHLWLPDGEWRVTVDAAGYHPRTITVAASAEGEVAEIALSPR